MASQHSRCIKLLELTEQMKYTAVNNGEQ